MEILPYGLGHRWRGSHTQVGEEYDVKNFDFKKFSGVGQETAEETARNRKERDEREPTLNLRLREIERKSHYIIPSIYYSSGLSTGLLPYTLPIHLLPPVVNVYNF